MNSTILTHPPRRARMHGRRNHRLILALVMLVHTQISQAAPPVLRPSVPRSVDNLAPAVEELVKSKAAGNSPERVDELHKLLDATRKEPNDKKQLADLAKATAATAKIFSVKARVEVKSKATQGHTVKYQTVDSRRQGATPATADLPTDRTRLEVDWGVYHIWCVDKDGKAISDPDARYEVLGSTAVVELTVKS